MLQFHCGIFPECNLCEQLGFAVQASLKFDLDLHILLWTEAVFKRKHTFIDGISWWFCD
jgi:hypothetical protein